MKEKPSILLVYGSPASGKTTIARKICGQENIDYISIGEISRREIVLRSELGLQLKDCLDRVVEYPPELVTRAVKPRVEDGVRKNKKIILDGFPKYEAEVPYFVDLAKQNEVTEVKAIHLKLSLEEVIDRTKYRRICEACGDQITIKTVEKSACDKCGGSLIIRDDDQPEIIRRRYGDYQRTVDKTIQLLGQYQEITITEIDASKSIEDVFEQINYIFKTCPSSSAERATT